MKIEWLGYCCTLITSGDNTILIDPYDGSAGLTAVRKKARVVVSTAPHPWHDNVSAAGSEAIVINHSGEYESGGVFFTLLPIINGTGFGVKDKPASVLKIQAEGLSLVYTGVLKMPIPPAIEDELGNVDILLMPVGGGELASAEQATKLMREIEPRAVVPLAFAQAGLKPKLGAAASFLSEAGLKASAPEEGWRVAKKDLPVETTMVKILIPS